MNIKKIFFYLFLLAIISCKKENKKNDNSWIITPKGTLPEIVTHPVTNIKDTMARGGGKILNNGDSKIIEKGICWKEGGTPSIVDYKATYDKDEDEFFLIMKPLKPNTTYWVRAYAINNTGINYGGIVTFKTLP